jgi:PKD repeat protein
VRIRTILIATALLATLPLAPSPASGTNQSQPTQPPLDPTKLDYTPIGYYGPADEAGTPVGESATIPNPSGGPPSLNDNNPSGKYVAYDTDVWEGLTLPERHPGDNCNALAPEDRFADCLAGDMDDDASDPVARTGYTGYEGPNGVSTVHGTCPPSPDTPTAGECFNNQLEYLDYYEHTMETMLADFGVTVKRYPFHSPGRGRGGVPGGSPGASGGQAYNIAAVIPGTDHPEEQVIVGAHYDVTDTAPAPVWDSAEGHAEIIRMAYIMSDYWRKTGTRPSATIKFMPWDSEESGTFGSIDYVKNNIPPDQESTVRGYFNVDPCAGAYPAYKDGNFADRTNEVLQLADPAVFESEPAIKSRIEAFNTMALKVVDQTFDNLDDSLTTPTGEEPIFVSDAEAAAGNDGTQAVTTSHRGVIVKALGGLQLFGSDYSNFAALGIPIFNLFPDYFGPHADGEVGNPDGIAILHTNADNFLRLNKFTSALASPLPVPDPTGMFASEGWAKGMEMCAQMESWGMLQPEMAGAQTSTTSPVAYFEALPNEAIENQAVNFDASGSYQYSNVASRTRQPESALSYAWDYGDGTTGTGKIAPHAYAKVGKYTAKLTVTGAGGTTDTMSVPIVVIGSTFLGPVLDPIAPADAEDGNFPLKWTFDGTRSGFEKYGVEESADYQVLLGDDATNLDNWEVEPPVNGVEPWQPSDSSTPKVRGNINHSAPRGFWAGVSPENFNPGPADGSAIMMTKAPLTVPTKGDPELTYWSLFQNEGDDSGRVEIALTAPGTPADQLRWDAVDVIQGQYCDPQEPDVTLTREMESRRIDLAKYAGKQILVRFHYQTGPDNRAATQPCGWYVDDISLHAGTWTQIGTSKEKQFVVSDRPNGTYAYRVKGIYNDAVSTAASNPELAKVTKSKVLPNADLARCLKAAGNVVLGSDGKDKLVGTKGNDVLCGFNGNDKLNGKGGNDVVYGNGGNDKVRGGAGNDKLYGDKGKDTLSGGKGNDKLKGGPKPDRLKGGSGKNKCGHNSQDTISC